MSLALVILGATLTSFTNYYRNAEAAARRSTTPPQMARNAMDLAARQLRNLANQDPSQQTTTIARALPFDLVFQTSDPSRKWVRYCLDTAATGGSRSTASRGMLWESETATAAAPTGGMMGSLPGHAAGSRSGIVADHVTNRIGGVDRPVFTYRCADRRAGRLPGERRRLHAHHEHQARSCTSTPTRARRPQELRVVSSIFLRNQNEAPVAELHLDGRPAPRTVILNALGVDRPRGPHARLRLVPRQRHDHAHAGGGLRAGDQAEGQRHHADLPRPGHDLPLRGARPASPRR